jgi:hypothetical protein
LSEWRFRAIDAVEVLTISATYFQPRSPLDRRLGELARKHCGTEKTKWRIGVDKLQKKCSFKQARKHVVDDLRETVKGYRARRRFCRRLPPRGLGRGARNPGQRLGDRRGVEVRGRGAP